MITVTLSDFRPFETFNLKWRFTDARWNLLPYKDLKQICILTEEKATDMVKFALDFYGRDGMISEFENVEELRTEFMDEQEVTTWLLDHHHDVSTEVIVSWDNENAAVTTWAIFTKYWNAFCYPSSDNVAIFPLDESWMLAWYHSEVFEFGIRTDQDA
jgi:hypothetical protein